MAQKKKILWIDTETTGVDPAKHGIIQIGALFEIEGRIVDQYEAKFQPHKGAEINPDALAVTGTKQEELFTRKTSIEAYNDFKRWIEKYIDKYNRADKAYPAGYNVRFDLEFVERWFRFNGNQYGTGSYQNWRYLDPLPILYRMDYAGSLDLPNYKLGTVCSHYGIEIEAHDALSDVKAAREVMMRLTPDKK